MPSASAKIEKLASSEAADPIKQFNNVLEKKVRNLEKRKLKLDNYKSDVKNGKELNEDQRNAVNKYDQVVELLEYSKELCKSLNAIIIESSRIQKKLAKKEQIERQQHEIQRLQEAFYYRHILSCLENDIVRNDFLTGENGAVKLSCEDLHCLDQLYKLIGPSLPNDQADVESYFHILAENFIFLVEGKNKEIAGTTYKALKELLLSIKQSGYFSKPSENNDETSSDDAPELEEPFVPVEKQVPVDTNVSNSGADAATYVSEDNVHIEVADTTAIIPECLDGSGENLTAGQEGVLDGEAISYAGQNGSLQEVLDSQGSFNFLQESQIELDTPHMDPAVVAVHQMPPPAAVNYSVTSYSTPQQAEDVHKISNGIDHVSSPVAQQPMPIMTSSVPQTMTSVLTSVQHNSAPEFDPTHPIPTQTFTNQNFAVMQNMIMPPAYVPVTMHHGPLPPHITPIAVVPGLSPPVSTPTSAVPIHVTVASVPVSTEASPVVPSVEPSNSELENEEHEHLGMNGNASGPEVASTQNSGSGEKTNDTEGFTTQSNYQRGYRGRGRGRGSTNGYFRGRGYNNNARGGYQNNYYQGNFRRGGPRGGRGNGNMRVGRGGSYRSQQSQQNQ